MKLHDPIAAIDGLNQAQKRALKTYEVSTIGELIRMLPRRYDDYSRTVAIADAPIQNPVTLKVKIESIQKQPGFRRRITIIRAVVTDQTGSIRVIWFNQPWLLEELKPGREIFLSGSLSFRPKFGRQLSNPIWEPVESESVAAGTVAPVYPLQGSVAQKTMRDLMARIMDELEPIEDPLSDEMLRSLALTSLSDAYKRIHRPKSMEDAETGRRRLAFDEFLIYRLALGSSREESNQAGAPTVPFDEAFAKRFVSGLPFELTADQKRAAWTVINDMKGTHPMRRLLQGDVGSGKTVVAALLMSLVYRGGASAVLMAPTEIVAKQHAKTLRRFLQGSETAPLLLLTSSEKTIWEGNEEVSLHPHEARERIREGRIIAVGTHALLERDMLPPDTALTVIDEQHRFGVAQREALTVQTRGDGKVPHFLSMTATPIPRSLALTLYGDLDISLIRTKPAGRSEIKTKVVLGADRELAYDHIRSEAKQGRRAYVICPLIEESDTLGFKSAIEQAKHLSKGPLKGLRIALLHGRMKAADKDGVMKAFRDGLYDVLVATTVVEVGVDVPEATVIAIESAERFGLAQLHQLRGRVGRSIHASACYLLSDAGGAAIDRLRVLERTNDGFVIAEEDLKRRGEGNMLGIEQSGQPIFRAGLATDLELMAHAKQTAEEMIKTDPELTSHQALRALVMTMRQTAHQE